MSDTAVLLKHYRLLAKNIDSFSDGQARLKREEDDTDGDDSLTAIRVTLEPRSGPYRGGSFDFEIDTSDGYPTSPPVVRCQTHIYHPNIDSYDSCEGEVCLNLLDELWTSEMSLEDVVQGLLFLLHEPNLDDPLSSLFDGSEDEEEFKERVRQSLRGEEVDGIPFEKNLADWFVSEEEEEKVEQNTTETTEPPAASDTVTMETQEDDDTETPTKTPSTEEDGSTDLPTLDPPTLPSRPLSPSEVPHNTAGSIESSVDRDDMNIAASSQNRTFFNGFSKMWTIVLSDIVRTMVLGPSAELPSLGQIRRQTSSSVDVR